MLEFYQIYNLDAGGDEDELITFWSQKFEGKGYDEAECGRKLLVKNALLRQLHTIQRSATEDHLVYFSCLLFAITGVWCNRNSTLQNWRVLSVDDEVWSLLLLLSTCLML